MASSADGFAWSEGSVEADLDRSVFLTVSEFSRLRRSASAVLCKKVDGIMAPPQRRSLTEAFAFTRKHGEAPRQGGRAQAPLETRKDL